MTNSSFSDASQEAYHLTYEQTRSFLNRTLQDWWWAEIEEFDEFEADKAERERCPVFLPSPVTPSVCSTSAKFLRRQPMVNNSDLNVNRTTTVIARIPAFQSFSPSQEPTNRRRRDSSFNNSLAARVWIASGEAILASSGSVTLGLDRSHPTDSASSSSWLEDIYSTWNHDMAKVMMTTKTQHSSRTNHTQNLWLQPPIGGLPGGSANIVHANHKALEQYVQHATDLFQISSNSSHSSSPTKVKQEENLDSIVYNLFYYIFHGTFPSSSSKKINTSQQFSYIHTSLQALGQSMPRKVCQHPFKKNELVWVCRTCQSDETCVLCHACYQNSCHEGHDVSFYHAQAGGCCDCGDPEAWDPTGFCHLHGARKDDDSSWNTNSNLEARCGGVVKACSEWLMTHIAFQVEEGYIRANPESAKSSTLRLGLDEPTTRTTRSDSLPLERRGKRPSSVTMSNSNEDSEIINLGQGNLKQPTIRKFHSVDGSTQVVAHSTGGDDIVASNKDDFEQNILAAPSESRNITNHLQLPGDDNQISFNAEAASTSKSRLGSAAINHDTSEQLGGEDLYENVFLFDAAGSSKGRPTNMPTSGSGLAAISNTPANLGYLGSEQYGLYIVLHADDIHTMTEITSALRTLYSSSTTPGSIGSKYQSSHYYLLDPILSKIARLLKASGEVIVYGTHELIAELGPVLSQCWKDGDYAACARFGSLTLEKAKILTRAGFIVSIKTRLELYNEVRAKAIIQLLSLLSESCDPLCLQVSLGLSGRYPYSLNTNEPTKVAGCLTHMLLSDLKLPRMITTAWHSLLLLLLSNPVFKRELANSYCEVYSVVSNEYAKGIGLQEMSCFVLSVQFLNRASFVQSLVRDRGLISVICGCLLDMLSLALKKNNGNIDESDAFYPRDLFGDHSLNPWTLPPTAAATDLAMGRRSDSHRAYFGQVVLSSCMPNRPSNRLDPTHPVLSSKRYLPVISDFKYVLNVKGMARIFASLPAHRSKTIRIRRKCTPSLEAFLEALTLAQCMDEQIWRKVEEGHVENELRSWIFAFNASISLGSLSERLLNWNDDDPIPWDTGTTNGAGVTLLSAVDLTHYVLTNFIFRWMKMEIINFPPTDLRFGLSIHDSSSLYLPISSVACSNGAPTVMRALPVAQSHPWSFHHPLLRFVAFSFNELSRRPCNQAFESLLVKIRETEGNSKPDDLYRGLMEFIIILLSRVAQIKAGLYRRNGSNMLDQVLNYGETPFCRLFRDADITCLQFSISALAHINDLHFKDGQCVAIFSQFVHLMIHRFGIFDFVGLVPVQNTNIENAWTYQPSNDRSSCLILLDDFLHTVIIMLTELPSPPLNPLDEVENAKIRLRRELIHRLASGPKTHSELGEVIHMLCMRDNEILVNEGKKINPDDAIGSSIQAILKDVATCTQGRGGIAPDEYQLNKNSWAEYDPAFFHMSSVNHQVAADNKPSPDISIPQPYSPTLLPANRFFSRLRKNLTSDATMIAIIYRILHAHLSFHTHLAEMPDTPLIYNMENMCEIVLCRAIQFLTLGAHVWSDPSERSPFSSEASDYVALKEGSVFYHFSFERKPSISDWIDCVLLKDPKDIMQNEAFGAEDTILVLLSRLGGRGIPLSGKAVIRDKSLRSGAAWLCKLASEYNANAEAVLRRSGESTYDKQTEASSKKIMEIRMNEAKQRILNKMKAQIEKFTSASEVYDAFDEYNSGDTIFEKDSVTVASQNDDFSLKTTAVMNELHNTSTLSSPESPPVSCHDLPRCVICAEEDYRQEIMDGKTLTFCAFIQPSTVLLCSGAVVSEERDEYDRFVGTHISLCGHAVHSSCCEAYLKSLTQREDRDRFDGVRKSEFKCPLCQRLSNCLVPFVDIDSAWEESDTTPDTTSDYQSSNIDHFLRYSKWWSLRNDNSVTWDGRCSFIPSTDTPSSPKRKSGKVDLYRAWDVLLSPYRLLTNKRFCPKTEVEIIEAFEENADIGTINDVSSTTTTDVWRRLIDMISDTAYRTDLKRLGENDLARNFGEFRHYLVEKHAHNNALLSKSQLEWPQCLSFINTLSDQQRLCISREKPIARLLTSIQTFTYTCCSESMELQRLLSNSPGGKLTNDIQRRFGISEITECGRVIICPHSIKEGRFGRLRYFMLALIRASSALHREIVQLSIGFPALTSRPPHTDENKRAPIAYPILCSNVLTHITAVICSISGTANQDWHSAREASVHFVALGLVANIVQPLFSHFQIPHEKSRKMEDELVDALSMTPMTQEHSYMSIDWLNTCRLLLLQILGYSKIRKGEEKFEWNSPHTSGKSEFMVEFTKACERARKNGEQFLRHALLILQLAMPPWSDQIQQTHRMIRDGNSLDTLEQLQLLIGIAPIKELIQSQLVCDILEEWYSASKVKTSSSHELNVHYSIREVDWPMTQSLIVDHSHYPAGLIDSEIFLPGSDNTVPLMGIALPSLFRVNTGLPRLDAVPLSYTDLYARVSELLPFCDQCAFCFLCGQVLNAGGVGECTKHANVCSGGAGIFFLLQECVSLIMYREKAAYFHSPYVDSHGETHMSRGRPLNIDMERYETLRGLYCGHLLRQQVVSERLKSTRHTIISNYY